MRFILWATAAVLALLPVPATARASFLFQFDQSSYGVAPAGTVAVQVFLVETGGTALRDFGLLSAAVRVNVTGVTPGGMPARVLLPGDVAPNPAFDFSTTDADGQT